MFNCCCDAEGATPMVETDGLSNVPAERDPVPASWSKPSVETPKAASPKAASPKAAEEPQKKTDDGTFHIKVDAKPGDRVGLDVAGLGPFMRVKAISAGIIRDWNARNPKEALQVGDLIVSVNGVEGDASSSADKHLPVLRALQQKEPLDILVRRQA
mmetsp:Transcript_99359/g.195182  ORF Transcript_99359/g.195182 Transcript_99359/m.195182 type:complete len:157 (-) Transcript_99359:201-671(-)